MSVLNFFNFKSLHNDDSYCIFAPKIFYLFNLNLFFMLKIRVLVPDRTVVSEFKVLYSNSVPLDMSIKTDFNNLLSSLRFLYPHPNVIIEMSFMS